jgi:EAL domain-containing protein (putative c-di-GMP-specific phosphodiesterase class I)
VVAAALVARRDLPANCFLSVNVSPHLLTQPALADVLLAADDLTGLVLELTEHVAVEDTGPLVALLDQLRAAGASVALDDSGSGYSGLQQMASLRPQIVKLDRALVADADTDPVRVALAEMLGEFAGRIDAWLLAEGIETPAELAVFHRLGVPLAQGWLLGRPTPTFQQLTPEVTRMVRAQAVRARLTESVSSLLRPVRQIDELTGREIPPAVVVGPVGEPVAVLLQDARTREVYRAPVSMRVHPSADIDETLQRALTRPAPHRFEPVLCTDPTGAVLGLLRVEDLASAARHR